MGDYSLLVEEIKLISESAFPRLILYKGSEENIVDVIKGLFFLMMEILFNSFVRLCS